MTYSKESSSAELTLESNHLRTCIDQAMDKTIDTGSIVGAVVIVAKNSEIVYQRAAGFSNREGEKPMAIDDIFRLSSLSKPIVSTAALSMIDAGKFTLEDSVNKWIPEFKPRLADNSEPLITIQHLMTHTAGLSYSFLEADDGPYNSAGVSNGMDQPGLTMQENLNRIMSVPLSYQPGTSWGYSVATDVLGELLARVGDRPLPEIISNYVTGPLGMHDTDFKIADKDRLTVAYVDGDPQPIPMADHQAVPFFGNTLSLAPERLLNPRSFPSGGSGMAGTALDFLQLLEMLRTGDNNLLSNNSLKELSSNQTGDNIIPMAGPGWGYGLMSTVLQDPVAAETPQSIGTLKWGGVYGHNWFIDPALGLSVIILTNTAVGGLLSEFPDDIRDAVYGGIFPAGSR